MEIRRSAVAKRVNPLSKKINFSNRRFMNECGIFRRSETVIQRVLESSGLISP